VYDEKGLLLLRFRTDVISQKNIDDAYNAMEDFVLAKQTVKPQMRL
jgi:hypothetical protein